jgi:spore maturation protein CgeB
MRIVVLGLSLTSSWGNGHASTYRSLLAALARRGHDILFLERDVPWYANNRDLTAAEYARVELYRSIDQLRGELAAPIADADLVVVGSYVPQGVEAVDVVLERARGVTAFYDIDTPITLAMLADGRDEYLSRRQVPRFDLYLSFSGGPVLECLEAQYGARRARPLYCSIDPETYRPDPQPERWHLGYLGTYSEDRAAGLAMRLVEPARRWPDGRFVVAGPQFPPSTTWSSNVDRVDHIPPGEHGRFYGAQRFTLNLTREAMTRAGYSPSVRLFEAAACGVPIITDPWPGLETFFVPGEDILVSRSTAETLTYLADLPDAERIRIASNARARVLSAHTAAHRAAELEAYAEKLLHS